VEHPEEKRLLRRPGRRWADNINMDLGKIGWDDVNWIDLAQDRGPVKGSCEHGTEPSASMKCW
jgi:hypothetical protein